MEKKERDIEILPNSKNVYQPDTPIEQIINTVKDRVNNVLKDTPTGRIKNTVKDKVNTVLNSSGNSSSTHRTKGKSTMAQSTTTKQNYQLQLDTCRDFCIGIEMWQKMNRQTVTDLEQAIQTASISLEDFHPTMKQHWSIFEDRVNNSNQILDKQRDTIQRHAQRIVAKQQKTGNGQTLQLNRSLKGGLVDTMKEGLKK